MQEYLRVIEASGRKTSTDIWECLRSSEEDGRTAAEYLIKKRPRPTAILASSDRLALGVMEVARSYRLRIPEDLAVVGFDDIPAARMSVPRLTTVRQPFEEKGRAAVAALLKEKGPQGSIPEVAVLTSSGKNCLKAERPWNAAGSRTSTAFHGRSIPRL
jgi:DNA-binding LacI/PurR family transcriptional regulator